MCFPFKGNLNNCLAKLEQLWGLVRGLLLCRLTESNQYL